MNPITVDCPCGIRNYVHVHIPPMMPMIQQQHFASMPMIQQQHFASMQKEDEIRRRLNDRKAQLNEVLQNIDDASEKMHTINEDLHSAYKRKEDAIAKRERELQEKEEAFARKMQVLVKREKNLKKREVRMKSDMEALNAERAVHDEKRNFAIELDAREKRVKASEEMARLLKERDDQIASMRAGIVDLQKKEAELKDRESNLKERSASLKRERKAFNRAQKKAFLATKKVMSANRIARCWRRFNVRQMQRLRDMQSKQRELVTLYGERIKAFVKQDTDIRLKLKISENNNVTISNQAADAYARFLNLKGMHTLMKVNFYRISSLFSALIMAHPIRELFHREEEDSIQRAEYHNAFSKSWNTILLV